MRRRSSHILPLPRVLRALFIAFCFYAFSRNAQFAAAATDTVRANPSTFHDGETGVLFLQDGGVLEGTITQAANWYVVGRNGSQMQVALNRVLYVGHSLHDGYLYRLQHGVEGTADSHLALAEWCLRYDMIDEATAELQSARTLGGSQGRATLIERRLTAAKTRLERHPPAPQTAPQPATDTQPPALDIAPSRNLPAGAVEMFTRKVQPVLVNNCTASKCHQPGGQQSFQLNRALLRGEANRRTTMQNLAAALALVDSQHPEASQLLTVPRQTHGGMTGPVFGARQGQAFKHLADWVALVAPTAPPAEIAAAEPPQAAPATIAKSRLPAPKQFHADGPPTQIDPAVQPAAATEEVEEPVESLRRPHRLIRGVTSQKWEPRDPFDAEIFNRRQRGSNTPALGPAPPKTSQ